MTDIPAKTPNPMGRTDNFFPSAVDWIAPVAEFEASAAAAETDAVESAPGAAPPVGLGTKLVGTEEAGPLTTAPPPPAAAEEDAEADDDEADDEAERNEEDDDADEDEDDDELEELDEAV